MKLKDLHGFNMGVGSFMQEKIDFKLAYRLIKIIKKIEPELFAMDAARKVLVEKYGKKNERGSMDVIPANMEAFSKDMEALLEQEVKIDFEPIPLAMLEKVEKIGAATLLALEPFIEFVK
jgi:hypothetical protein